MGFFARGAEPDPEQAESLARIEAGKIPSRAEERLAELTGEGSLFTSGLSVNEFALLGRMGPAPLAQVMGASVVRPGWQYLPALDPGTAVIGTYYGPGSSGRALQNRFIEASPAAVRTYQWHAEVVCELHMLTDAWSMARRRALDRLYDEALQVGADAIVGVHLVRSDHDLGKGAIEYVVRGTAIRLPQSNASGWPVLTDMSVQDYWKLHVIGHEPAGFVATTTVVFASAPRTTRIHRTRTTQQSQELEELSKGFHAARDTVRARLLGQVSDAHGVGAVGVEFSHSVRREKLAVASAVQSQGLQGWHMGRLGIPYKVSGHTDAERAGWVITMHAAGTAIRPRRERSGPAVKTSLRMGGR